MFVVCKWVIKPVYNEILGYFDTENEAKDFLKHEAIVNGLTVSELQENYLVRVE